MRVVISQRVLNVYLALAVFVGDGFLGPALSLGPGLLVVPVDSLDVEPEDADVLALLAAFALVLLDLLHVLLLAVEQEFLVVGPAVLALLPGLLLGVEELEVERYLLGVVDVAHWLAVLLARGKALDGLELVPDIDLAVLLRVGLVEFLVGEVEVDLALDSAMVGPPLAFLLDLVDDGAAESARST